MPVYHYVCRKCGWEGDVIRSMGDRSVKACLKCGEVVTPVISAVPRIWKGGTPS